MITKAFGIITRTSTPVGSVLACWMVLVGWIMACSQKEVPNTPEDVYRAFSLAVLERDWDLAIQYIDPKVVEHFGSMGRLLLGGSGSEVNPLDVFLQNVECQAYVSTRIKEKSRNPDQVVLEVRQVGECEKKDAQNRKNSCRTAEVRLNRVKDQWKVVPELPIEFDHMLSTRGGNQP